MLLKQTLILYNINCAELADEIGVSEATIRQWQTGRNFLSKSTFDKLYPALKAAVDAMTNPALSAQVAIYISEHIPSAAHLVERDKDDCGNLIVNTLKLCYTRGKACSKEFGSFSNLYSPSNKTRAVVFDFDGTLTEGHTIKTTWESLWIELGYDVEECRALHRKFDSKLITHKEWCRLTAEKFLKRNLHIRTLNEISSKIKLMDGCEETFKALKASNIKIFIVSGSILCIIQNVLRGLTMYVDSIKANDFTFTVDGVFSDIIGTSYDFEGKAQFISELAELLKISTADILFVGNSYNDKFVYASGARTLCINPKNTDPSDRVIWNDCILDCTNLKQILPFVKM